MRPEKGSQPYYVALLRIPPADAEKFMQRSLPILWEVVQGNTVSVDYSLGYPLVYEGEDRLLQGEVDAIATIAADAIAGKAERLENTFISAMANHLLLGGLHTTEESERERKDWPDIMGTLSVDGKVRHDVLAETLQWRKDVDHCPLPDWCAHLQFSPGHTVALPMAKMVTLVVDWPKGIGMQRRVYRHSHDVFNARSFYSGEDDYIDSTGVYFGPGSHMDGSVRVGVGRFFQLAEAAGMRVKHEVQYQTRQGMEWGWNPKGFLGQLRNLPINIPNMFEK